MILNTLLIKVCSLPVRLYQRHVGNMHKNSLKDLMNGPIREKLKIIPNCVKWGGTFLSASVDLMSCIIAFYSICIL